MEGVFALISSALGIISIILNAYMSAAPKRTEKQRNEEIEQGRKDITDGNVDAVMQRIDKLCLAEDDSHAGIQDDQNEAR